MIPTDFTTNLPMPDKERVWSCRFLLTLLLAVSGLCGEVSGQTVHVAQKKVSKRIAADGLAKIVLGSEKADMVIEAWEKPEVWVEAELSARHPDKHVAVTDLEKVELVLNKERKVFFIRDFILLKGKDEKPQSNLKASYVIYAPAHLALEIQGAFGMVSLKGFRSRVNLKANFCDVRLERLSGAAELNTAFGKLDAQQLTGRLDLSAHHTQVVLKAVGGEVKLATTFGTLHVAPGAQLASLHLNLKKTTVDLVCPEWRKYSYAISGAYTKFKLPDGFKGGASPEELQQFTYKGSDQTAVVVQAEFGNLTIR